MNSHQIRTLFLDYFQQKGHFVETSAPLVQKNDPTLMFINAGMNQFKDAFLGEVKPKSNRITDTQKCLRVSGKHNDLDDVGYDTYHHTLFEMLGNWSFGDYFKAEAIQWCWEFLIQELKLDPSRFYATYFEGNTEQGLEADLDAKAEWLKYLPEERILTGNMKDNFWEMGESGPCGPCSELHYDNRTDEERNKVSGIELVNADHPQVIEVWNLVFMEFNRMANGSLVPLPAKHVDTGMGFERLVRIVQGKQSNYDTDVFEYLLSAIASISGKQYGKNEKTDIAFRVIADHIRAITFTIADGQLPSNTGAGYVIRRILRRAVRYAYSYLDISEPFLYVLAEKTAENFALVFPEAKQQISLISSVIKEEEAAFFRTLESGIKRFQQIAEKSSKQVSGKDVFELYDTYGFPADLSEVLAKEQGLSVDQAGFDAEMKLQKERSKKATTQETGDWTVLTSGSPSFVGYDQLTSETEVLKYRLVKRGKQELIQAQLSVSPFYPEGGGQVGDKGQLKFEHQTFQVVDSKKENDTPTVFIAKATDLPSGKATAQVNSTLRKASQRNHSATHLLHSALREVLGSHVEQKGSYVGPDYLRFDFSHFEKITVEQLTSVEDIVNQKVLENIDLIEDRAISFEEAKKKGAMALFGEKYGDKVRMITFDPRFSVELCGGTHVQATGEIGQAIITSETGVAAGIRRIEMITGEAALESVRTQQAMISEMKSLLNSPHPLKAIEGLQKEIKQQQDLISEYKEKEKFAINNLISTHFEQKKGVKIAVVRLKVADASLMKDIAFQVEQKHNPMIACLLFECNEKPFIHCIGSKQVVTEYGIHFGKLVKHLGKHIQGGGGGQDFYASAGGKKIEGLDAVGKEFEEYLTEQGL